MNNSLLYILIVVNLALFLFARVKKAKAIYMLLLSFPFLLLYGLLIFSKSYSIWSAIFFVLFAGVILFNGIHKVWKENKYGVVNDKESKGKSKTQLTIASVAILTTAAIYFIFMWNAGL